MSTNRTKLFFYHYLNSYNLEDYDKYYLGKRANDFHKLDNIIRTNADCHLDVDDQQFVVHAFWNRASEETDIVENIIERVNNLN